MEEQHVSRALGVAKVVADTPFEVRMIDAYAFHVALDEPLARFLREAACSEECVAAPRA